MITSQNQNSGNRLQGYLQTLLSSKKSYIVLFLLILVVGAGALLWRAGGSDMPGDAIEVDWRVLGQLDYITGKGTPDLESLDGKTVKVPGFMVPLEDNSRKVTEFLLVPSPQACIHVPPPPPNQMVYVKMEDDGTQVAFGPIWVYGTLHLKSQKHQYGEASFSISGLRTSKYE
jgi:hypothetical protein